MNLKVLLLVTIIGISGHLFAMEDPVVICRLCKNIIIDEASAVRVCEQQKSYLVHRFCFERFLAWSQKNDNELGYGYHDSDDDREDLSVCCNLQAMLNYFSTMWLREKKQ